MLLTLRFSCERVELGAMDGLNTGRELKLESLREGVWPPRFSDSYRAALDQHRRLESADGCHPFHRAARLSQHDRPAHDATAL
jgi:hypothetical protein